MKNSLLCKILFNLQIINALFLFSLSCYSQSRLVLNNNPYLVMQGGIYLVVANENANAITCLPVDCYSNGRIISENENNKVKWIVKTTIGDYIVPYYYSTAMTPFRFNKTTVGTESSPGSGYLSTCTWFTAANATWPSGTSLCNILQKTM